MALTTFTALVLSPGAALAYRTALSSEGVDGDVPPAWQSGFAFSISSAQPSSLAFSDVESAFHEARAVWRSTSCASPLVSYAGASVHSGVFGDGISSIEWVEFGWTDMGLLADAMATTDINLVQQADGRWDITEADIRINAQHFDWVVGVPAAGSSAKNLTAVLTHELGHALGLLHPCEPVSSGDAPACGATYTAAALYPLYGGRESLGLAADDRDGLCAIYPCEAGDCSGSCVGTDCAPVDMRCTTDFECGAGHCIDTVCVHAPLFDACATPVECDSGMCGADGYCTVACSASCGDRALCVEGECRPTLAVFGESCEYADDCQSDVCLEFAGDARCSRACTASSGCPIGYGCMALDDERVCVPDNDTSCSVTAPAHRSDGGATSAWILVFASMWIARRRSSWLRGNE